MNNSIKTIVNINKGLKYFLKDLKIIVLILFFYLNIIKIIYRLIMKK